MIHLWMYTLLNRQLAEMNSSNELSLVKLGRLDYGVSHFSELIIHLQITVTVKLAQLSCARHLCIFLLWFDSTCSLKEKNHSKLILTDQLYLPDGSCVPQDNSSPIYCGPQNGLLRMKIK